MSLVNFEDIELVKPKVNIGGKIRSGEGQFYYPWGVAVDKITDNIYVTDFCNHRVQLFNSEGRYLFKFGDRDGAGRMAFPRCLAISLNTAIVSQNRVGCLLVYDLIGNFITEIKHVGRVRKRFSPYGLVIDDLNGDIYVCDYCNNRIQVYLHDSFTSSFGDEITATPMDIQLTKDNIYVLSDQYHYLYTFNYDLSQVQNTISEYISKYSILRLIGTRLFQASCPN